MEGQGGGGGGEGDVHLSTALGDFMVHKREELVKDKRQISPHISFSKINGFGSHKIFAYAHVYKHILWNYE